MIASAARSCILLVPLLICAGAGLTAGNDAYESVAERYKPGRWGQLPLKARRDAVQDISLVNDVRAADLLLDLMRPQMKIAQQFGRTWKKEEAAWTKKTVKLETPVEKRRREAYREGRTPMISGEARDWIGSTRVTGAMYAAKKRIENLYRDVVQEQWIVFLMGRGMIHLTQRLEGKARAAAMERLHKAYVRLEPWQRPDFVHHLGLLPDASLEPWLLEMAGRRDRRLASAALFALGSRGTPTATAAVLERLAAPRWQDRAAAIHALQATQDATVVDAMMKQAVKEGGALKRHYHLAFTALFAKEHAQNPAAWARWWEQNRAICDQAWATGRALGGVKLESLPSAGLGGSTSFYGIHTDSRHIVFVVDMSSSMKSTGGKGQKRSRFEVAKQELAKAINSLNEDDGDDAGPASFNIVLFGTFVDVYRKDGMVIATADARRKALAWVEKTAMPVGKTNSYDALAAAFDIARRENERPVGRAADTIYFMTDAGQPNRGKFHGIQVLLHAVGRLNDGRHLTIHAVGVGTSTDPEMLKSLSSRNGGLTATR